jgi:hypothetical protein
MAEIDDKIEALLNEPAHGKWEPDGKQFVYTPNPSAFDEITPMQLAKYFADKGDGIYVLKLP